MITSTKSIVGRALIANQAKDREFEKKERVKAGTYQKKYYQKNKEKIRKQHKVKKVELDAYSYKVYHNATKEQIAQMLVVQDNKCLLCGKPLDVDKRRCVDNHLETGKALGVLHHNCKVLITKLKEDPNLFASIQTYLGTHQKKTVHLITGIARIGPVR